MDIDCAICEHCVLAGNRRGPCTIGTRASDKLCVAAVDWWLGSNGYRLPELYPLCNRW